MRHEVDLGELLENLDVEAYLDSQGLDYKAARGRSGRQLMLTHCPFCGHDGEGKVYINAENGLGSCFAGSHPPPNNFNIFSFIRAHTQLNGRATVEHIQQHVSSRGWMPKRVKTAVPDAPVQLKLPESYPLPFDGRNITYLENRGITSDIAAYFNLRYCHEGWFNYELDGQRKGMKFDQRVLIPVFDLYGELVNFQGRDVTGLAERKYQFPPGLSSTGTQLLNGHKVHDTKRVLIAEGFFDVAASKMALDEDPATRDVIPIGTFGKELSWGQGESQQSKLLVLKARGVTDLTFMWDGEILATNAAVKAGLRAKGLGFNVSIAMLPKDKDPNEVPASVVRECFANAIPLSQLSAITILMKRRSMNTT